MSENTFSRRSFLTGAGLAGAALGATALVGCTPSAKTEEGPAEAQNTSGLHSGESAPDLGLSRRRHRF